MTNTALEAIASLSGKNTNQPFAQCVDDGQFLSLFDRESPMPAETSLPTEFKATPDMIERGWASTGTNPNLPALPKWHAA